jgi:hypothetical protein
VGQSLNARLDSLAEARVIRDFPEKVSTRTTRRPESEAAVKLAGEIRSPGAAVTLVVHEHKRLGRGIEPAMPAEELKASDSGRHSGADRARPTTAAAAAASNGSPGPAAADRSHGSGPQHQWEGRCGPVTRPCRRTQRA